MSLRDANRQFSKLVREGAEAGEEIVVLRNGKAAVKIVPVQQPGKRTLTPAREAALKSFLDLARASTAKSDGPWTREELYER